MPLTNIVFALAIIVALFVLHTIVSDWVKQRRYYKYIVEISKEE